jgi:hypothetical protein
VSRGTWDTARAFLDFVYRAITFYGRTFQTVHLSSKVPYRGPATPFDKSKGLGCSDFARHYFRNHNCFLFLQVLRCFSSLGLLPYPMYSDKDDPFFNGPGFPIRKSPDRSLLSGSPRLIAASHALHRHLLPRHPPYARSSLTKTRHTFGVHQIL